MPLILPLTKGHLSNEDNYLTKGVSLLEGDYCTYMYMCSCSDILQKSRTKNIAVQIVLNHEWVTGV